MRNVSLHCIVVVGLSTLGSMETLIRDATDKGYSTILIEDAVALDTSEEHQAVIKAIEKLGCFVVKTNELLNQLENVTFSS